MDYACRFLLVPDGMRKDLSTSCLVPDIGSINGVTEKLNHILIPIPGGYLGNAKAAIMGLLEEVSKTTQPEIRATDVGKLSHYLIDVTQPFHTSLYSVYRLGYHNIVEADVEHNFRDWTSEYSPHPPKIGNFGSFVEETAKASQAMSNELLLAFAKRELMGGDYPDDLEKKVLFRAIDNQIAILQYFREKKLLEW
jgi:hypothetical protein